MFFTHTITFLEHISPRYKPSDSKPNPIIKILHNLPIPRSTTLHLLLHIPCPPATLHTALCLLLLVIIMNNFRIERTPKMFLLLLPWLYLTFPHDLTKYCGICCCYFGIVWYLYFMFWDNWLLFRFG